MSNLNNINLEENLYEDYKGDLEKKYFGGINQVGEPWFKKTTSEIEDRGRKKWLRNLWTGTLKSSGLEPWSIVKNTL